MRSKFTLIKVHFTHWLPRLLRVEGIVVYPFVLFARSQQEISPSLLNHEMIHVRQIRRMGVISFYYSYLKEYGMNLFRYRSHAQAYFHISFEQEAYSQQESILLTEEEKKEFSVPFKSS